MRYSEKFLVIGSNSFSGSHFVAHALKNGFKVVGASRSQEPSDIFLPYKWGDCEPFEFHQLDINNDLDEMMRVIKEFKPDYIVNFAAQSMVAQSWVSPEDWFMTNTVSMVKLHDRLRTCNFLKKYIHISTPEVYGTTDGLVSENAPFEPSTPYAVSKAACDMSLNSFFKAYHFPVVFIRSANVCGPGQPLYRIIPRTIFRILTGGKLKLEGNGKSVRSFINIQDVCKGILLAVKSGKLGETFHFSTDENVSIRALVEKICLKMNVLFDDVVELVGERLGKDAAYLLNDSKARRELGWKPIISLDETISQTIGWTKDNLGELKKQTTEYIHKK